MQQTYFHEASGTHVGNGQPFTIGGTQYPPNWLDNASADEVAAIGLTPVVVVGDRKDDTYFDNAEVLDGAMLTITATPKDAGTIKAIKWEAIKSERDRRKAGGFKVEVDSKYKWFHSDAESRIQLLGLKDKARDLIAGGGVMTDKLTILGQTVKWKTMDGSFVDVSAQVAFDIVSAAGDLDAQIFAVAEGHRVAMEASADPASYDYSTGWPKIYGE